MSKLWANLCCRGAEEVEWEVKLLTILIILRFIVQFDGNEKQKLCHFSKFPLDIFPIFHTFILHFALCSVTLWAHQHFENWNFVCNGMICVPLCFGSMAIFFRSKLSWYDNWFPMYKYISSFRKTHFYFYFSTKSATIQKKTSFSSWTERTNSSDNSRRACILYIFI